MVLKLLTLPRVDVAVDELLEFLEISLVIASILFIPYLFLRLAYQRKVQKKSWGGDLGSRRGLVGDQASELSVTETLILLGFENISSQDSPCQLRNEVQPGVHDS